MEALYTSERRIEANEESSGTATILPLQGRAFMAERGSGSAPDAYPLATETLLIAAAGSGGTPPHTVDMGGLDGLYDALYGDLLPRTAAHDALLAGSFGASEDETTAPIARYAAVLAEAAALSVMSETGVSVPPAQIAALLAGEITERIKMLRDLLRIDGFETVDVDTLALSLAVCRLTVEDEGLYTVDIWSAGRYGLYLLDARGLRPLWTGEDPRLVPDSAPGQTELPAVHRVDLIHPEPFALLLLSEGVTDAGERAVPGKEPSGRVWRHRMRLEEAILHLLTACVREQELGERASQYFAAHIPTGSSAAGAFLLCAGERGFEELCEPSRIRLSQIEDLLTLLPDGYHPLTAPVISSRSETEMAYLSEMIRAHADLEYRTADAVYLTVLELLRHRGEQPRTESTLPDTLLDSELLIDDIRRISEEELEQAFARYSADDEEDKGQIAENRRVMREAFSAHWVTWRPLLVTVARHLEVERQHTDDEEEHGGASLTLYRSARDRDYAALLVLNARLGERLAQRRHILRDMEEILAASTRRLRTEGTDWLNGRGGEENAMAWSAAVAEEIPRRIARFRAWYREDTDAYRSLLVAYTSEREALFARDTTHPNGFFAVLWEAISDGALADDAWGAMVEQLHSVDLGESYEERLEAIRQISRGTGALRARIERRGAERRTAQALAQQHELRVAALRASVYGDPVWEAKELLNTEQIRRFAEHLRRHEEAARLDQRRRESFEAYRTMYESEL